MFSKASTQNLCVGFLSGDKDGTSFPSWEFPPLGLLFLHVPQVLLVPLSPPQSPGASPHPGRRRPGFKSEILFRKPLKH